MKLALLKKTWAGFNEDKALRLASSIAFSTIFAIAPLFIVLIAILGWFLGFSNGGHGHHVAENALLDRIRASAGNGTAETVRGIISASFSKPRQGIIAQVIGWVAFIAGAAGLFSALQDALNAIWHVESTKGGWKQILRDRIASFGMILITGFLLIATFVANAAIAFLSTNYLTHIPVIGSPAALAVIGQLVTFAVVTVIFALIYKILPDVTIAWHDVWVGAAVTSVLFVLGQLLIGLYMAKAGVASAYGAAGSILVALLWIYYSALILMLGAEFTKAAAGAVKTVAPSSIRKLVEQPAGVDPREAAANPPPDRRTFERSNVADGQAVSGRPPTRRSMR